MGKNPIMQETIIQKIYEAHFATSDPFHVPSVRDEKHWDEALFHEVVKQLVSNGLIAIRVAGGYYRITLPGILYAEDNDLIPRETRRKNRSARISILSALAVLYKKHGNMRIHIGTVAQESNVEIRCVALNLQVLDYQGLADVEMGGGLARITNSGLQLVAQSSV